MSIQINKQSFPFSNEKSRQQSLLSTAFEVLLRNLGPQKTSQLWQILTPLRADYISEKKKLFKGKSVTSLYKQAKKFNKK